MPACSYADAAALPLQLKGLYELSYAGMRVGNMGIEIDQTPEHYAITSDIATSGLAKMFVKHNSHTTVGGSGHDFIYPHIEYETHYQTRNKKKYVKMIYKDGAVEETLIPPDNRKTRPAVAPELKKDSSDPLSLILRIRQGLFEARASKKDAFIIKAYDGRRLTQVAFTIAGTRTITYKNKPLSVIAVDSRRTLLGGFTASELADYSPKEPTLHSYFTDDERLLPIRLETSLWIGTLSATLAKECRTGESCLLGLK
jgi:hypothetical protein